MSLLMSVKAWKKVKEIKGCSWPEGDNLSCSFLTNYLNLYVIKSGQFWTRSSCPKGYSIGQLSKDLLVVSKIAQQIEKIINKENER